MVEWNTGTRETKALRERIERRMTGGHPDQREPDPLFRDMYNYVLLEEERVRVAIEKYRAFMAHQAKIEVLHFLADVPHNLKSNLECMPLDLYSGL